MKKELVIPQSWQHHVMQATISSIAMCFDVEVLSITQSDDHASDFSIILLSNNGLGFAVKYDGNWQCYKNLEALIEHCSDIDVIQHVYFGLFKLWQCLTPSKARKIVLRNRLYQESIGDAVKDTSSSMYFDRLVYVTGHLYRFVIRVLQKESPNWSVIAEPIICGETPSKHLLNLDNAE